MKPKNPLFLSSELSLGQLKTTEELTELVSYWNEHWTALRRQCSAAEPPAEKARLSAAATQAATQAFRLEAVIKLRQEQRPGLLFNLFKDAVKNHHGSGFNYAFAAA